VKRTGHLFAEACAFKSLTAAALTAARGKKANPGVALFLWDLENEVIRLEEELRARSYRPAAYRTFKIRDPKERTICAADFRDRVVHHALCRMLTPIFERALIADTFACRQNKGPLAAVKRAQGFSRRHDYFLKLDVHKFFDSVDHGVLKHQLRGKVKDPDLLWLLEVFIDHPVPWTERGKGIPIGNLTSQHFANFHLSGLDHYIKQDLRIGGYVRYMDDLVLWADEKDTLRDAAARIAGYLRERLALRVKAGSLLLAPVFQGLPFLGFRVFPGLIRIDRRGWRRFRRKALAVEGQFHAGEIDPDTRQRRMASLVGHLQQAQTRNLRAPFFHRPGAEEPPTV